MHEWALIDSVVKEILDLAEKNKMTKVESVSLGLGEEGHITEETMEMCFRSLAKGTILEKTTLENKKTAGSGVVILSVKGAKDDEA